jgi:coenzyme F420-reducing hydrogenase gamma subunit
MKPKIGIFGLSGCWGEQIVILNCEDELLSIVGAVDIVDFLGGSSRNDEDGPLTVAFVEGSVGSAKQESSLKRIRERSALLVGCGTCACFGGISAMDAGSTRAEMADTVYGVGHPSYDLSPHRPLSDFVKVDAAIPGCPMEKDEFVRAVTALLNGDLPQAAAYPVCTDCKWREQECLLISRGIACAGPVTAAGCGARCPGFNVPCIGCRGPVDEANFASMTEILEKTTLPHEHVRRRLRLFAAPVIDRESAEV